MLHVDRSQTGRGGDRRLPLARPEGGKTHDQGADASGEVLLEEPLVRMGLPQLQLATAIHMPYQRVNELATGRRGVTPGTALRLSGFFGTMPGFRMNLQLRWNLYHAQVQGDRVLGRSSE